MRLNFKGWLLAAALVAGLAVVGGESRAETAGVGSVAGGGSIAAIRVDGTQRIEPVTVRSYLAVQPGDPFDAERLDRSLKTLFGTGLFADVTLRREGGTLIVTVVENPIINRLAFEGNRRLKEDQLQSEVQLRPRVVYTRTRVQSDVQRIVDLYRRNGRFAATVEPKVIKLDQNRVDLVFEIDEGPRTDVARINFVGNEKFGRGTLMGVLQTKESHWYRFLSSDDTYDPDRLNYDKELLRRYYLTQGYADFRVVSAVAELTPERDAFYITFTVEEGERYKFGKVNLTSNLKGLDPEVLRDELSVEEGDWFNAKAVENSITVLTDKLGAMQFPFVDVQPRVDRHRDELTVDVTFEINEGPRQYVERIEITGNVRTLDRVIRREMLVAEGDPYNASKIKRSEKRIKDLNFFEKVNVTTTEGSQPDQTVIQVDVTEQSTGEISLGAGYSTVDGPLGDFSISEHNLLGTGRDLRFGALISGIRSQFSVSFTEPYFLNRDMAAGFDVFRTSTDNQSYSSYKETDTGARFRVGFPLTERLRQNVYYSFQQTRISDILTYASPYILSEIGTRNVSLVGQQLVYDTRDSKKDPTSGYILQFTSEVAGAGGDAQFARFRVGGSYYYPIPGWDQWIGSISGEGGYIQGLGQTVNISDRFFLGGDSMHGFETAGLGPRDIATNDSLGGNQYYRATIDVKFPVGLPDELGVTGHAFTDIGSLSNVEASGPTVRDSGSIRVAPGVGVQWRSPLGPVGIDLSYPVLKESYDRVQEFRFNFGTRF